MHVLLNYSVLGSNKHDLNFSKNMFQFVFHLILDAWGLMGLFKLASPSEICYKKYGCFSTEKPFTNTKGILPEKPQSMGVRFLLYTRKNPRKAKKLKRCGKREDRSSIDHMHVKHITFIVKTFPYYNNCYSLGIILQ